MRAGSFKRLLGSGVACFKVAKRQNEGCELEQYHTNQ